MKYAVLILLLICVTGWAQAPTPGPYQGLTKFVGIVLRTYAVTPTTTITGTTVLNSSTQLRIYNGTRWLKADGTAGGF